MFGELFNSEENDDTGGVAEACPGKKRSHRAKPTEGRGTYGFVGLENQGATCYLNSLIQALYMTPELRTGIFDIDPIDLGVELAADGLSLKKEEESVNAPSKLDGCEELINILTQMGFSNNGAKRSILQTSNNMEEALAYALTHGEDTGFNDPVDGDNYTANSTSSVATATEGNGGRKKKRKPRHIPIELQQLFSRMQLVDKKAISTEDLTRKGFQWQGMDGRVQHDAHELNRLLIDALEMSLKNCPSGGHDLCQRLYKGLLVNNTQCLACTHSSKRDEHYYDVLLQVLGCGDIVQSLRQYTTAELLTNDNRYACDTCNSKQDALRCVKLTHFPQILTFSCQRFDIDRKTWQRVKVITKCEFPLVLDMTHFLSGATAACSKPLFEPMSAETSYVQSMKASMIWLEEVCVVAKAVAVELVDRYGETCIGEGGRVLETLLTASQWGTIEEQLLFTHKPKPVTTNQQECVPLYDLFAVIMHRGTAYSGHYFAYIRDCIGEGNWSMADYVEATEKVKSSGRKDYSDGEVGDVPLCVPCAACPAAFLVLESSPLALIIEILQGQEKSINFGDIGKQVKLKTKKSWGEKFKEHHGTLTEFCKSFPQFFSFSYGDKFVELTSEYLGLPVEFEFASAKKMKANLETEIAVSVSSSVTEDVEIDAERQQELERKAAWVNIVSQYLECKYYGQYYEFNDSIVKPMPLKDLSRSFEGKDSAYMLVYRQRNEGQRGGAERGAKRAERCKSVTSKCATDTHTHDDCVRITRDICPPQVPILWQNITMRTNEDLAMQRHNYEFTSYNIKFRIYCPSNVSYKYPLLYSKASVSGVGVVTCEIDGRLSVNDLAQLYFQKVASAVGDNEEEKWLDQQSMDNNTSWASAVVQENVDGINASQLKDLCSRICLPVDEKNIDNFSNKLIGSVCPFSFSPITRFHLSKDSVTVKITPVPVEAKKDSKKVKGKNKKSGKKVAEEAAAAKAQAAIEESKASDVEEAYYISQRLSASASLQDSIADLNLSSIIDDYFTLVLWNGSTLPCIESVAETGANMVYATNNALVQNVPWVVSVSLLGTPTHGADMGEEDESLPADSQPPGPPIPSTEGKVDVISKNDSFVLVKDLMVGEACKQIIQGVGMEASRACVYVVEKTLIATEDSSLNTDKTARSLSKKFKKNSKTIHKVPPSVGMLPKRMSQGLVAIPLWYNGALHKAVNKTSMISDLKGTEFLVEDMECRGLDDVTLSSRYISARNRMWTLVVEKDFITADVLHWLRLEQELLPAGNEGTQAALQKADKEPTNKQDIKAPSMTSVTSDGFNRTDTITMEVDHLETIKDFKLRCLKVLNVPEHIVSHIRLRTDVLSGTGVVSEEHGLVFKMPTIRNGSYLYMEKGKVSQSAVTDQKVSLQVRVVRGNDTSCVTVNPMMLGYIHKEGNVVVSKELTVIELKRMIVWTHVLGFEGAPPAPQVGDAGDDKEQAFVITDDRIAALDREMNSYRFRKTNWCQESGALLEEWRTVSNGSKAVTSSPNTLAVEGFQSDTLLLLEEGRLPVKGETTVKVYGWFLSYFLMKEKRAKDELATVAAIAAAAKQSTKKKSTADVSVAMPGAEPLSADMALQVLEEMILLETRKQHGVATTDALSTEGLLGACTRDSLPEWLFAPVYLGDFDCLDSCTVVELQHKIHAMIESFFSHAAITHSEGKVEETSFSSQFSPDQILIRELRADGLPGVGHWSTEKVSQGGGPIRNISSVKMASPAVTRFPKSIIFEVLPAAQAVIALEASRKAASFLIWAMRGELNQTPEANVKCSSSTVRMVPVAPVENSLCSIAVSGGQSPTLGHLRTPLAAAFNIDSGNLRIFKFNCTTHKWFAITSPPVVFGKKKVDINIRRPPYSFVEGDIVCCFEVLPLDLPKGTTAEYEVDRPKDVAFRENMLLQSVSKGKASGKSSASSTSRRNRPEVALKLGGDMNFSDDDDEGDAPV